MFSLFAAKGQLGIDFGDSIKIAEFKDDHFKTAVYDKLSKEDLKEFSAQKVITAIGSDDVKVKFIPLATKLNDSELKEMLSLQFEADDLVIQYDIVDYLDKKYVIGLAVNKDIVQSKFDQIRDLKLKAKVIETEFHANLRFLYYQYPDLKDTVSLVDIGREKTDLIIAQQGELLFFRKVDFAGRQITERLAKINRISFAEAEKYKKSGVDKEELKIILEELRSQIYSSIDYFQSEYKGRVSKIFLTGGGSNFKGLKNYLEDQLGIEVESIEDSLFSLAKGLALREL
ncbi:pilus assembly protein PilM [Orenia marismortui]|uniref:pilus assembly protein PilM n=1 Tax=Orenia marismortui TaxID=46469 RepID=UPI0003632ACA|nr:pilus assembly protein PilM [Orenia marismortui]